METGKVTGANVSVRIDDDFMNAAVNNGTYRQQYPTDSAVPSIVKDIDAAALWGKIIHNAWKSAEPGVLFLGHNCKGERPGLLCGPWLPDHIH